MRLETALSFRAIKAMEAYVLERMRGNVQRDEGILFNLIVVAAGHRDLDECRHLVERIERERDEPTTIDEDGLEAACIDICSELVDAEDDEAFYQACHRIRVAEDIDIHGFLYAEFSGELSISPPRI